MLKWTYGDRESINISPFLVSVTLGENFSFWRFLLNSVLNRFVLYQLKRSPGLLYAEVTSDWKNGLRQTITVWDGPTLKRFKNEGAHHFAMRKFRWLLLSGQVHSYFLTWYSEHIPTSAEATEIVKQYGRFYNGSVLLRQAKPQLVETKAIQESV